MNIEGGTSIDFSPDRGGGGGGDMERMRREDEERKRKDEERKRKENREKKGRNERNEEDENYWRAETYFKMMVADLRLLDGVETESEEKKEIVERLEKRYEQVGKMQMKEMSGCMKKTIEKYRNPHPHDSRNVHFWLDSMGDVLGRAELEFGNNKEAMMWLKQLKRDYLWGEGMVNMMDGFGPIVKAFWSGSKMMEAVKEGIRNDIEAKDFMKVFMESLPGLEVEEGESGEKKEGLREKAVKYQNENTFWRMAVSSVGQMEYDKEEGVKMPMELNENQIKLIQLVFGRGDKKGDELVDYYGEGVKTPKSILNLYSCDSSESSMEEYRSLMKSLLCLGVKEELERVSNEEDLMKLANRIKEDAKKKKDGFFDEGSLSTEEWLADVVTKFGVMFDWGSGAAAEMGWGWKYEVNEKGKVERSVVSGGTTTATDLTTERYWLVSHAGNKDKNWTVNPMFPKMSEEMRGLLKKFAPGTKIRWDGNAKGVDLNELRRRAENDPRLLEEIELMQIRQHAENDPKLQKALTELFAFGWNAEERAFLEKNMWLWDTGIVGENSLDDNGVRLIIPVFFPPEIEGLNFLDTVSLIGDEKLKSGDPSVWDELCQGKKMSEINWESMQNQKFYKWMITIGQALNTTRVLLQEMNDMNKGEFLKFFASNDNMGQLLKRTDLSVRDGKQSIAMLTMSYVSFVTPLFVAKYQAKISGGKGNEADNQSAFIEIMSQWWDEAGGLPKKRDGVVTEHYAEGMKKMMEFYIKLISRMGFVVGDRKIGAKRSDFDEVKGKVYKFTNRSISGSGKTEKVLKES